MNPKKILVVFGAPDHEEKLSRQLCKVLGVKTGTARKSGVPCHAGNAYAADDFRYDEELPQDAEVEVVRFECSLEWVSTPAECDHHRPGDPGYDKGPSEFWMGSSLGQLASILGYPTPESVDTLLGLAPGTAAMTAANDHCPAQAYRGLCPGILPGDFERFRFEYLAAQFGKTVDQVYEETDSWAKVMAMSSQGTFLGGGHKMREIHDLRFAGVLKDRETKALIAEVGLNTGRGYIYLSLNGGGKEELCLGGLNSPETVEATMAWMSVICGGRKPYGVPARGYAGIELNPS